MHTKLVFPLTDSDESCSILKIDLAGSERASATLNSGLRLNEGAKINRSLLALANCINKLAQQEQDSSVDGKVVTRSRRASTGSTSKSVVNYRDSKLTHLLKSSLEGSCRMIMIANINPNSAFYEDSHNTLKYANRAKSIKVKPQTTETSGGFGQFSSTTQSTNQSSTSRRKTGVVSLKRSMSARLGTKVTPVVSHDSDCYIAPSAQAVLSSTSDIALPGVLEGEAARNSATSEDSSAMGVQPSGMIENPLQRSLVSLNPKVGSTVDNDVVLALRVRVVELERKLAEAEVAKLEFTDSAAKADARCAELEERLRILTDQSKSNAAKSEARCQELEEQLCVLSNQQEDNAINSTQVPSSSDVPDSTKVPASSEVCTESTEPQLRDEINSSTAAFETSLYVEDATERAEENQMQEVQELKTDVAEERQEKVTVEDMAQKPSDTETKHVDRNEGGTRRRHSLIPRYRSSSGGGALGSILSDNFGPISGGEAPKSAAKRTRRTPAHGRRGLEDVTNVDGRSSTANEKPTPGSSTSGWWPKSVRRSTRQRRSSIGISDGLTAGDMLAAITGDASNSKRRKLMR